MVRTDSAEHENQQKRENIKADQRRGANEKGEGIASK